jgi:hypothetical protein
MKLFDKCPVCGGDLVTKEVEKMLKGGTNTAIVKVKPSLWRRSICIKNQFPFRRYQEKTH